MRRLKVSDVMTTEVITAREATPFKELARIMTERRVSALPVLDTADRLVGMVSEADLLPKEEHRDDHPGRWALKFGGDHASRIKAAGDTAGHLKTPPVVVTHPDASLVEAAKEMAATRQAATGGGHRRPPGRHHQQGRPAQGIPARRRGNPARGDQ